jgi:alpha-tubulin suppressor-like RCC1 family protein
LDHNPLILDCNLKSEDYDPTIQDWNWKMVACGQHSTIAVKTDGTLWSVGLNNYGQLGQNDTINRTEFTRIGTDTNWDKCYMGEYSAAAITKDGDVYTWGNNEFCQLGLGHTNPVYLPELVSFDSDPDHNVKIKEVSVSVDGTFMTAVSQAGGIYGWGYDEMGYLFPQCSGGSGSGESGVSAVCTPCRFGKKCDWDSISSGEEYIAAIKKNGTIWTWGVFEPPA